MRAGIVVPRLDGVITDANFFGFGADAEDGHGCVAPPRVKGTVRGGTVDRDGTRRDLAGITYTEKFTFLVGECVAVVFVEGPATVFAGVDAQLQRACGLLASVLRHRLHGKNGASANVEWHFV